MINEYCNESTNKNRKYLIFIILAAILCSSCASAPETKSVEDEETPTKEAVVSERQPIYTYGQRSNSKELILFFGGEPASISSGYIKLVGTIGGKNPQALIEIGGKGRMFSNGELIGEYQIVSILNKEVKLCLRK